MPQRPEEHILEDRSIQAFKTRLPDEWIFRGETPDYGVDGNVEIAAEGRVTGRRFHVQLKATGQEGKVSTYIKRETAEYYLGLDQPVLIVFYNDCEDVLYARWMHLFDPYYGGWSEKNVRLRFSDTDRWAPDTPESIKSEVERISAIRRDAYTGPIGFHLDITEPEVGGHTSVRLKSAFQSIIAPLRGVFETVSDPEDALGTIEANSEEVTTRLGTKVSVFHLRGEKLDRRSLAANLAMQVGVILTQSGKYAKAVSVFAEVAPLCSDTVLNQLDTVIIHAMQQSGRVQAAMDLGERLKERETPPIFLPFLFASHLMQESLSTRNKKLVEERLRRKIDKFSGAPNEQSRLHYNYGNLLFHESRYFEAFKQFRQAGGLDPHYWERDYFCQEFAGILFECGRYRQSIKYYRCAIELGGSDWILPRLADALMFAGKYREALETFSEYMKSEPEPFELTWHLEYTLLRLIVDVLGVEEQTRNRERARQIANPFQESPDGTYAAEETPPERFMQALTEDALDETAWHNLAWSYYREEEWEQSTLAYMASAVIERGNAKEWAQAYLTALNWIALGNEFLLDQVPTIDLDADDIDESELVDIDAPEGFPAEEFALQSLIGQAAYQTVGEKFVDALWEEIEDQPNIPPVFLQHMEAVVDQIKAEAERDHPRIMRFIDEDGSYSKLEFPLGESNYS